MIHSDDIVRFDRWSKTYDSSIAQRIFFDRVHRAVLEELGKMPVQTVVDVGCGTGRLLRAVYARWPEARLIGVDASQGMIDVARQKLPVAEFHAAPAERLPLPDETADVVLSTISFHHWEDRVAGVREVTRILRGNGRFILADVSVPAWMSRLGIGGPIMSAGGFAKAFSAAGLNVVSQRPAFSRFVMLTVGVHGPRLS